LKTVTIQIGNTGDKLSPEQWSKCVEQMHITIQAHGMLNFFGNSPAEMQWRSAAWIVVPYEGKLEALKQAILFSRQAWSQEPAAWTEGETVFV
jgi:hypothetical protein